MAWDYNPIHNHFQCHFWVWPIFSFRASWRHLQNSEFLAIFYSFNIIQTVPWVLASCRQLGEATLCELPIWNTWQQELSRRIIVAKLHGPLTYSLWQHDSYKPIIAATFYHPFFSGSSLQGWSKSGTMDSLSKLYSKNIWQQGISKWLIKPVRAEQLTLSILVQGTSKFHS